MKKPQEILRVQAKEGLGDLWDELEDKRLMPAYSESSMRLNNCLERLYNLEIKSDFDNLKSKKNEIVPPFEYLGSISNRLISVGNIVEEFLSYGYKNKSALRKVSQVSKTNNLLDSVLLSYTKKLYKEFDEKSIMLKKRRNNKEACKSLRQDLDNISDNYYKLLEIERKRKLKVNEESYKKLLEYTQKREKINKIKRKISLIHERYLSFDSTTKPLKELKQIKKDIKNGWFFKSRMAKDCLESNYYEGIIELKRLKKEITIVEDNLEDILNTKINLFNDKHKIVENCRKIERISNEDITLQDLEELGSIHKELQPTKYDFYKGLLYLKKEVLGYKTITSSLKNKTYYLILNRKTNLEKIRKEERLKEKDKIRAHELDRLKIETEREKIKEKEEVKKLEEKIEEERFDGYLRTKRTITPLETNNPDSGENFDDFLRRKRNHRQNKSPFTQNERSLKHPLHLKDINKNTQSYFNLKMFVQSLNYPQSNNYLKIRRGVLNNDGIRIIENLNLELSSLIKSETFADSKENLDYIESIYFGIKESLERGQHLVVKNQKSNEPLLQNLFNNFENYISRSRMLVA